MLITALHSGQLPTSSATRRAQFSRNLACPQGTKAKPSMGANKHTSHHRDGVSVAAGVPGIDAATVCSCSTSSFSSPSFSSLANSSHSIFRVQYPPNILRTLIKHSRKLFSRCSLNVIFLCI